MKKMSLGLSIYLGSLQASITCQPLESRDTTAEQRRLGSLGSDFWVYTPAQLFTRSVNRCIT